MEVATDVLRWLVGRRWVVGGKVGARVGNILQGCAGVVGGCGKFVRIQSGGGDCFHRYIGGITALPHPSSQQGRQTTNKAKKTTTKELFPRVRARASRVCGSLESRVELVVAITRGGSELLAR